jgi:hypothetical protein
MPMLRRRRPVLRAAAVGGAAYMGKRAGEKKNSPEQGFQPEQQQAAPSGGLTPASTAQLSEIASLHDRGVLTDAEFEQQKRALLGQSG